MLADKIKYSILLNIWENNKSNFVELRNAIYNFYMLDVKSNTSYFAISK